MEIEKIISYIDHPEQMDQSALPILLDLITKYPYCQTFHLLSKENDLVGYSLFLYFCR